MEGCKEAASLVHDLESHGVMPSDFAEMDKKLREVEEEERRQEWKVCGCKGCEKWGARGKGVGVY